MHQPFDSDREEEDAVRMRRQHLQTLQLPTQMNTMMIDSFSQLTTDVAHMLLVALTNPWLKEKNKTKQLCSLG